MKLIKYWKEIILFGLYGIILWVCKSPDISSKFYGNDNPSLLYGAKFLEIRYPDPLYTFLGYPIANLPFGVDGGNLVIFLSIIPSFISSILVFLSIKKVTDNKLAPWIGATTLMGCYFFFSQSMIIQKYPLIAVMAIASFYCIVSGRFVWANIFCGLTMGSHYMTGFFPFIAFMLCFKEFRKYWYVSIVTFLIIYLSFYLLVPVFYWEATASVSSFIIQQIIIAAKMNFLTDISKFGLLVVSLGLSLIPIILFIYNDFKRAAPFLFLFLVPLTYFGLGDHEYRFVNFAPFAPFYAIMAAMGVSYIKTKYLDKIVLIGSVLMMLSMPFVLNSSLVDSNPTSLRESIIQLDEVEDGSIIVCSRLMKYEEGIVSDTLGGHVASLVDYYNRTNKSGKSLVPFDLNAIFDSKNGLTEKLGKEGVYVPPDDVRFNVTMTDNVWLNNELRYNYWFDSIARVNSARHVYYYRILDAEKETCELVKVQ